MSSTKKCSHVSMDTGFKSDISNQSNRYQTIFPYYAYNEGISFGKYCIEAYWDNTLGS